MYWRVSMASVVGEECFIIVLGTIALVFGIIVALISIWQNFLNNTEQVCRIYNIIGSLAYYYSFLHESLKISFQVSYHINE